MISFSRGRPTQRCQCRFHCVKGGDLHQDESPVSIEFLREINSLYNDSALALDEHRIHGTCSGSPTEGALCDPISKDLSPRQLSSDYDPQFGLARSMLLKQYSGVLSKLDDALLSKVEGFAALYYSLSQCVSQSQFLSILTLYLKTHTSSSITSVVNSFVEAMFTDFSPQDSSGKPAWLSLLSKSLSDWRLVANNPGFAKVSRVLSLLISLGVMDGARISIGGLNLFSASASKIQASAADLVDACIDTITFFAEGGYQCFAEGSIKPLLYSNSEVVELESRYIKMLSLWEYARNGNLKKFANMHDSQFDKQLCDLVEDLETAYKSASYGVEKKILAQRWKEMSLLQTDYESSRVRGGLRSAPFCFKVFGATSVGKSSFTDVVMSTLLKANGHASSDEHIITLNPDDKHMSNMRTYVTGIKIDDYGNTKLDYVDLAPSDWLIQICNNIKRYAVMADLANKGKISIEPSVVSITTNVEDLLAKHTSNEPLSIARRAHVHIKLEVRPEFRKVNDEGEVTHMLDPLKVFKKYGDSHDIQDLWLITVREPLATHYGDQTSFTMIDKPGFVDINIFDFLRYVIAQSKDHFMVQEALVTQQTELADKIPWCAECNVPSQLCDCCEPQFGERIADALNTRATSWGGSLSRLNCEVQARVEDYSVRSLISWLDWFERSPYARWTNYIPTSWLEHECVKSLAFYTAGEAIECDIKRLCSSWIFGTLSLLAYLCAVDRTEFVVPVSVLSLVSFLLCYCALVEYAKSAYYQRVVRENHVMPELFKRIRDEHVKYACATIAGFSIIWAGVKVFKALKSSVVVQGNLAPTSVSDILTRDSEENPWEGSPTSTASMGPCVGQNVEMENRIYKNLYYASYSVDGNLKFCNAIAIKTGYFIIPKHMLPTDPVQLNLCHSTFKMRTVLDPTAISTYSDLAMFYVANSPPIKDLSPFFSDTNEKKPVPARMVYTTNEGNRVTDRTMWVWAPDVCNGVAVFPGSYYNLSSVTFAGSCMATFFSESVTKCILGFHLGGRTGTNNGCGIAVTRSVITGMLANLRIRSGLHIDTPQGGDVPDEQLGKKFSTGGPVHRKSPLNFIPTDSAILCYGNVTGRASHNSVVVKTPISDAVHDVMGQPNLWGAPKFKDPVDKDGHTDNQLWKPWYASLKSCAQPAIGFPVSQIERAVQDYVGGLTDCLSQNPAFWQDQITPLTDVQVVSGIDGRRFIDAMKSSTSMGFPVGGAKSKYLLKLDPALFDDVTEPKLFTPQVMDEYAACMERWSQGELCNMVFGAALKDEPTLLTKDKVRVFQAAPVVLQMALRKMFLPVARFLSCNPLVSECAVGINAQGPEWDQLATHMARFGSDRVIAGDFRKYDLRMPASITQAAFVCMRDIAVWSGNYTPRDLKIMDSLVYEVTCPLVAFNGDLIRFLGTNPSGQNLTVYVNSIANSLLHRLGFFSVYPELPSFREIVSLSTYGDDSKGSVREGYDEFNHVSFANYLSRYGMELTMPDKTSVPIPFMKDRDVDFLKRRTRFDPDLGIQVGMLDEMSILKSLHSVLKSKAQTLEEVSAQNIDGALREWFYYGREVFEKRQSELKEIAKRTGMLCQDLDRTYDERVAAWHAKYDS